MDPEDAIKTTFKPSDSTYYYVCTPFGLKNVGASFQQAMNKIFPTQMGWILKAYVDENVVKSMTFGLQLEHLEETFKNLWMHNMRLNPEECVFRVCEGKFLGY